MGSLVGGVKYDRGVERLMSHKYMVIFHKPYKIEAELV